MTTLIDLDVLSFNGGLDDAGVDWSLGTISGWDGPTSDQDVLRMAARDGGALGRSRLGPRSLVLEGTVEAPSGEAHWAAYNALLAAVNNTVTPRWLTVHEPTPKRVKYIRRDAPSVRFHNGQWFEFQVALIALDALKYAVTPQQVTIPAGGSLAVTSSGNYPTPVLLTGGGNIAVTNQETGHALSTRYAVPTGSRFDAMARTARTAGGADLFDSLATSWEWLSAVPGGQTFRNDGDTAVDLTYHDAWL